MDIRFVESFVAVVEHGSLAEAARRLDLTPTAISSRIRALETQMGVSLLRRSGRTIRATEAGLRVFQTAKGLIRVSRDLSALAQEGRELGELRLGSFASALTSVLPLILERVFAVQPNLSLFVAHGASIELCRKVAAGELDAAVVVEPQFALPKTCQWFELHAEPLVLMVPEHLSQCDPLELLRVEPYIRYDRSVLGGQLAEQYLRQVGVFPNLRLEIDGVLPIAAMVSRGLGVSLLPDWSWLWSRGMSVARIELPGDVPLRRLGIVAAIHGPRRPLVRLVLEQAAEVFKKDVAGALEGLDEKAK